MFRIAAALLFVIVSTASAQERALEGVVKRSDGQPVLNALVAAIPTPAATRWDIAGTARSDANGVFRITGLKPGNYALTATSAIVGAGFVEQVTLPAATPVTITMTAGGRQLSGTLSATGGKPYRGRILAGRMSAFEGDLFVLETDDQGRFTAVMPAGRYMLGSPSPDTILDKMADLRESDAQLNLSMERAYADVPPNVVVWLKKDAIPLKTVVAGNGFEDMQPLKRIVGDARLVALGEATHGTREFFQLKHRMLEFLVSEMGFTAFGIEASTPDTVPVNEYVLNGTGDPAKAVAGMGFWTWSTEEVLDMVKWMRAYNEGSRHRNKLHFYGFDMQSPRASLGVVETYLKRVDPDVPLSGGFSALTNGPPGSYARSAGQETVRAAITETLNRLESRRAAYVAKSSEAEWTWSRRQLDLIKQAEEMFRNSENGSIARDRAMAENVKWTLDREPAGTKMVIWAHNGHVSTEGNPFVPDSSMGAQLRRMFGDKMRVFGFAFGRGTLQAVKRGGGGLTQHTAPPARVGSFDAALLTAGAPILAVNLRAAPPDVSEWLQSPLQHRSIGAVYSTESDSAYWIRMRPLRSFDALLFVADTTAARALSGGRVTAGPRPPQQPPAPAAVNLDFEDGESGAKPKGWGFPLMAEAAGFRATTVAQGCASGSRCAYVSRPKTEGEGFASLAQRIDAKPYRGKNIRFRAMVRSKLGAGSSARLWLRVDLEGNAGIGFFNNMGDKDPGPLADWTELEISGPVAGNAEAIAFGLLFVGEGEAWIDAASIEAQ